MITKAMIIRQFIKHNKHKDDIYIAYSQTRGFRVKYSDYDRPSWITYATFIHDFYTSDDDFWTRYGGTYPKKKKRVIKQYAGHVFTNAEIIKLKKQIAKNIEALAEKKRSKGYTFLTQHDRKVGINLIKNYKELTAMQKKIAKNAARGTGNIFGTESAEDFLTRINKR